MWAEEIGVMNPGNGNYYKFIRIFLKEHRTAF